MVNARAISSVVPPGTAIHANGLGRMVGRLTLHGDTPGGATLGSFRRPYLPLAVPRGGIGFDSRDLIEDLKFAKASHSRGGCATCATSTAPG